MKDSTASTHVEYNLEIETKDISITIPQVPHTLDTMSDTKLNTKLQHSYEQSLAGEGVPYNEVFDDLERSLVQ